MELSKLAGSSEDRHMRRPWHRQRGGLETITKLRPEANWLTDGHKNTGIGYSNMQSVHYQNYERNYSTDDAKDGL